MKTPKRNMMQLVDTVGYLLYQTIQVIVHHRMQMKMFRMKFVNEFDMWMQTQTCSILLYHSYLFICISIVIGHLFCRFEEDGDSIYVHSIINNNNNLFIHWKQCWIPFWNNTMRKQWSYQSSHKQKSMISEKCFWNNFCARELRQSNKNILNFK